MSKITRWEPMNELVSMRRDMDRMFEDFFTRPMTVQSGWNLPTVDMYQTEDDVVVKATIPGINPEDLDIQVTGDTLSIRAEVEQEKTDENAKYHLRERHYQSFSRSLTLPVQVVADKADAQIKNGILTLTLPKAEETKPKAITVKAK